MDGKRKLSVRLNAEERERLETLTRNGSNSAKRIMHARLLLMADQEHPQGRYKDAQIAKALGVHLNTIARTRRKFCRQGEKAAVDRKVRAMPPVPAKVDGALEARLVAICCTPAPEGRRCWLSILSRQGLNRGIRDEANLRRELEAWNGQRCREAPTVKWQFTTADARIKLHRLYPQF